MAKKRGVRMLLYGYAGSGKTTLLKTAPKPLVVFDFEGGADRILGDEPQVTLRLIEPTFVERKGKVLQDSRRSLHQALAELSYRKDIKTLAFDGFSTYLRKRLLEIVSFRHDDGVFHRPEYQDWFTLQLEMDNFITQFLYSTPAELVIFIAHRRLNKTEQGTMFVPDIIPRKLMDNLVGYVDVVCYAASPDMDPELEPYQIYLTSYQQLFFAKNRFGHPHQCEPDLTSLMSLWGFLPSETQPNTDDRQTNDRRTTNRQTITNRPTTNRPTTNNSALQQMWQRVVQYAEMVGLTQNDAKEALLTVCGEKGYDKERLKSLSPAELKTLERQTIEILAEVAFLKQPKTSDEANEGDKTVALTDAALVDTEKVLDELS